MPGFVSIEVEGIHDFNSALGRIDRRLQRELTAGMREIAGKVARRAQAIAEEKGLRQSGALIRGIKPGVRSGGAVVRETALRMTGKGAPYKYPGIYEFGGGKRPEGSAPSFRGAGPRAFLKPAADDEREGGVQIVTSLLDRLIAEEGLGMRGGPL
jgi:hypothetical protein